MTFTHPSIAHPDDLRRTRKLQRSRLASRGDRARGDHAPLERRGPAPDASPAKLTAWVRATEAGHG